MYLTKTDFQFEISGPGVFNRFLYMKNYYRRNGTLVVSTMMYVYTWGLHLPKMFDRISISICNGTSEIIPQMKDLTSLKSTPNF